MISTLPRRMTPIAALVTGLGSAAIALAPAAQAAAPSVTFSSIGAEQTWTVPPGVTSLHVVAIGGRGGISAGTIPGGFGAHLEADLSVTPGQTLYVEVGGNGQDIDANWVPAQGLGGFNGGGNGQLVGGAGGGGASDLRTVSAAVGAASLDSRLLVAAGGGGAGAGGAGGSCSQASTGGSLDGCPGAPTIGDGTLNGGPGGGGTQTGGGAGGIGCTICTNGTPGTLGSGGNGGVFSTTGGGPAGGGGGGGLYGGGGGGGGTYDGDGGGSGSSFVGSQAQLTSFSTDTTGTPSIAISWNLPAAPLATTQTATGVDQTSATLNGVVSPQGFATHYHFAYGADPNNYAGSTDETDVVPTDSAQHTVSATITGLAPGTHYYFRLVATNDNGTTNGDDLPFVTTLAPAGHAPTATSARATGVGQHQATLTGVVNPNGSGTTVSFQYGFSKKYTKTTAAQPVGSGTTNVSVQALLSGLPRHTWFHFRAVAVNAYGTTYGADRAFRTS